jgi:hypothetical protein
MRAIAKNYYQKPLLSSCGRLDLVAESEHDSVILSKIHQLLFFGGRLEVIDSKGVSSKFSFGEVNHAD